ncbi:hypothetical protein, conserved [Eimeria tenella]|uniref:Syntaxin binding protein n=1 Tax=Eimeria tenella TaxID=5802 RepID=U6KVQ6_EIMTE|nr:hypothetical protein, conserved [Eimeria tenella]CDJ42051.1 hypothetical protein, conserved [Eimeria tenella]|eukprot:XP_013232801.1 hypothetical protein, conserved [Eimeria tenella]
MQKSKPAHRFEEDRDKVRFFKQRAKRARYDLSRFEPAIREIMEKSIQGTLHRGLYPFVDEPSGRSAVEEPVRTKREPSVIGRSTEWTWDSALPEVVQKPQSSVSALDKSKKRLVVFVLGGILQSEMRCAYEVSKELNCEVFIGGTSILTPSQVLKQLKEQSSMN